MASVAKPRCARGQSCYHVRKFDHIDEPPKVRHEGDLCGKCEEELAGGYKSSYAEYWKDEVIKAIQSVQPGKEVLWDLFALSTYNGGWHKDHDLGKVLMRLDTRTLEAI